VAVAIDASSPARATGSTTNGTLVATTASFTPPANSVLVATAQANARTNGGGNGVGTGAITNSGTALTWTKINERNLADAGGLSGYAGIFVAVLTTSQAMTATLTMTAGTNSNDINTPTIKLYVVTGADLTTPNGGTTEGSSTTNALTTTGFTTVGASSMGFFSACDWNALGPTITSSDCTVDAGGAAGGTISYASGYKVLGTAGSSATFNIDAPGTNAAAWNWVTAEIEVAAAAATPMPMLATYAGPG
jgi:hypothetical protein